MSKLLFHPCTRFSVSFQYSRDRVFSTFDQVLLQFIASGGRLSEAPRILGMPTRMIVESAFDLLKERMLEMDAKILQVSDLGKDHKDNLVEYRRSEIVQANCNAWYDWNQSLVNITQFVDPGEDGTGEDEYSASVKNIKEPIPEGSKVVFGQRYYDHDEWKEKSRRLDYLFTERHRDGICEKIRLAVKRILGRKGQSLIMINNIEAPWHRFNLARLEKVAEPSPLSKNSAPPAIPQCSFSPEHWLLTRHAHCEWLKGVLSKARSHVFVFSGHEQTSALQDILRSIDCGARIHLVPGYPSSAASGGMTVPLPPQVHHHENGTDSDMKLVLYDDEFGWHMALGSFNWLNDFRRTDTTNSQTAESKDLSGLEISILLSDGEHAVTMAEITGALQRLLAKPGKKRADILKALEGVRESLEGRMSEATGDSMFVLGDAVEAECGNALRNSATRCLVCSHTVGQSKDSLRIVRDRENPTASTFLVAFSDLIILEDGKLQKAEGSQGRKYLQERMEMIKGAATHGKGILLQLPTLHSRIIIRDDVVTVSSLNVLASYRASTTTFGIRFIDKESATLLENVLLGLAPREFSIKERLAILTVIENGESTIEAEEIGRAHV